VSRELITRVLHVLSAFANPLIVLLHVIEVPSRTATLDPELYPKEIKDAEARLAEISEWLTGQGVSVRSKVAVARGVAEGIITETESDDYLVVFLMKRPVQRGWRRLFNRSVSEQVVRAANCLVMTAPLEKPSRPTENKGEKR
jgi:nucleotide-binding universal stress UspA family protein